MRIYVGSDLVLTVQRKGFIMYQCSKCGKTQLHEISVKGTSSAAIHTFGGKKSYAKTENKARQGAIENLDKLDDALFDAINNQQDYSKIYEPIVCRDCREQQIWSNNPVPWKQVRGYDYWLWGIKWSGCISLFLLFFIFSFSNLIPWFCITLLIFVFLALLPFFHRLKQKKALKAIQEASFQPPKYYNRTNIDELIDSKND